MKVSDLTYMHLGRQLEIEGEIINVTSFMVLTEYSTGRVRVDISDDPDGTAEMGGWQSYLADTLCYLLPEGRQ